MNINALYGCLIFVLSSFIQKVRRFTLNNYLVVQVEKPNRLRSKYIG
jgi:hypothetical protein